jgi:hypothetical protein
MDPVSLDETYEVSIILEGPVSVDDFKIFRDELKSFLDRFPSAPAIPAAGGNPAKPAWAGLQNHHPNKKKPFLQVREGRGGQRKNA